jgi:hypothetical protein
MTNKFKFEMLTREIIGFWSIGYLYCHEMNFHYIHLCKLIKEKVILQVVLAKIFKTLQQFSTCCVVFYKKNQLN